MTSLFSHHRFSRSVTICLITGLVLCCAAQAVPPQAENARNQETQAAEYVSINFDDVDIQVFIKFISKLTGKNFVVDNRVQGKVTVISPEKISIPEAYNVFQSVLEIHGFSTVRSGKVIKILPSPSAKSDNIDTRLISGPEMAVDRLVTRIVPLNYADAGELKTMFTPLLPKGSVILSYSDTNMLIVTATLASIDRLLKIVQAIDVPNIGKKISVIPLRNADASRLAQTLSGVFMARIKTPKGKINQDLAVQFVADDRTNSLVILASRVETERVEQLVALLDQDVPKGGERIRVYYLEHAKAEDLVKVLEQIPTQSSEKKGQGKKQGALLSSKFHISADKTTNSLIIIAEKEDYTVLEEVIAKLDIPRSMVYIECLIMEVNMTRGLDIGTEWKTGDTKGGKLIFGGFGGTGDSGYSNSSGVAKNGTLPKGFSLGVLGKNITIGGVTFPDIQAVIQALETDKDVHILSTPQLLTTENEEAVITVGKNVPYQTRSAAESGSETYSSYEYKDVGISLKITPQINQGKLVRLDVFQELTKLDEVANQSNQDRPTTLKRQIETAIIVEDGNSVVIGGLIDDQITTSETRTPCLGDVPGLGWAFKNVSEGGERTNLYVFITPRIVRNPMEADQIYKEKKADFNSSVKKGNVPLYQKINQVGDKIFSPQKKQMD